MTPRFANPLAAALLAATVLAGAAGAQTYTAWPIDNLHGVFGHWAPFGVLSTATNQADETRSHYMVPAPFLSGGGAVIVGIEAAAHVTGNVPYERLVIRCGLTTNTTLSPTFASNAPNFLPVYSRTNFSINWTGAWMPILFNTPFVWDGTSNLVIEIEKVIDRPNNPTLPTISHQFTTAPMRTDVPVPVFREGTYGSGAATAASGSLYNGGPLLMRLRWLGEPSLTITSTRNNGSYYAIGQTIGLTCQARSGDVFGVFIDAAFAPAPIQLPPIVGRFWLSSMILIYTGTVAANNLGTLNIPIPQDPSLAGARILFQCGVANASRLAFTNTVDAPIRLQ